MYDYTKDELYIEGLTLTFASLRELIQGHQVLIQSLVNEP